MSTQQGKTRFSVKSHWEVSEVVDPTAATSTPSTPVELIQDGKDNALLMSTVAVDNGTVNFSLVKLTLVQQGIVGLLLTGIVAATTVLLIVLISTGAGFERPRLLPDSYQVLKNTETILTPLLNDKDPKGSNLTIISTTSPLHGTVKIMGQQRIAYQPERGYSGYDHFNYTVSNDKARSTSYITILVLNNPPVPIDLVVDIDKNSVNNTVLLFELKSGVEKISDIDGDTLVIFSIDPLVSSSSLTYNNDSAMLEYNDTVIYYTPVKGFSGSDSYNYSISDGYDTAFAILTFNVKNSPPVAVPYQFTVNKYEISYLDILRDCTDLNDDEIFLLSVSSIGRSNAYLTQDQKTLIYEPLLQAEVYSDSFEYSITDRLDYAYSYALISIVNKAPTSSNVYQTVIGNSAQNKIVLSYEDGDLFDEPKISILKDPSNGLFELVESVTIKTELFQNRAFIDVAVHSYYISYTPDRRFVGNDTIVFMVSDGTDEVIRTVFIEVINLPPIANGTSVTCQKNLPMQFVATVNDGDANSDNITLALYSGVKYGSENGQFKYVDFETLSYQPANGFLGEETFEYEIIDLQLDEANTLSAIGTITVNVYNTDPVAVRDEFTVKKGVATALNVTWNDYDPNLDPVHIVSVGSTLLGQVAIVNNTIVYTAASLTIPETFTYTISDVDGANATTDVFVNVVNTPPVAVDDFVETPWGRFVTFNVLDNDYDEDPGDQQQLTIIDISNTTAGGTLELLSGNVMRYTPDGDYIGYDSFTYYITDNSDRSVHFATVNISVYNSAPVAVPDVGIEMHWSLRSIVISVLENDYDPDNDAISIVRIGQPAHGVTVQEGSKIRYTAEIGYTGQDTFEYEISDTVANTTTYVQLEVLNNIPVAVDDHASVHWRSETGVNIPILANDYDQDTAYDTIKLIDIVLPETFRGNVTVSEDLRSVRYIPPVDIPFKGVETFVYYITDGIYSDAMATVTVNVTNNVVPAKRTVNHRVHWSTQFNGGSSFTLFTAAVPVDTEGDFLTYTLFDANHGNVSSQVSGGTVTEINYIQQENFIGTDSFNIEICDGLDCANTTHVYEVYNNLPTASNYSISRHWQSIRFSGVTSQLFDNTLATDPDSEDRPVQIYSYEPVDEDLQVGNLTLSSSDLIFKPNAGWTGSYLARVVFTDGLDFVTSFINFTVTNTLPSKSTTDTNVFNVHWSFQTSGLYLDAKALLRDLDGDDITLLSVVGDSFVDIGESNGKTQVFYRQNVSYLGSDTFDLTVSDGWNQVVFTFDVNVYDTPPAVPAGVFNIHWALFDSGKLFDVMRNATDIDTQDSPSLMSSLETAPAHGSAVVENGQIRYTPNEKFVGVDSFQFRITDGLLVVVQSATVHVTNTAPVAVNDTISQTLHWRSKTFSFRVTDNDYDDDRDVISLYGIAQQPQFGTAAVESVSSGSLRYTVADSDIRLGDITFAYNVTDGVAVSSPGFVTVTVTNENVPVAGDQSLRIHWRTLLNTPPIFTVYTSTRDLDGDTYVLTVNQPSLGGTTSLVADGAIQNILYQHSNWSNTETFTYELSDGLSSDQGTITVNAYNTAPKGKNYYYDLVWDEVSSGIEIDVLRDATDEDIFDRNYLTYSIGDPITANFNGTVTISDNGILYKPKAIVAEETFTYYISDGNMAVLSNITINVQSSGADPFIFYTPTSWRSVLGSGLTIPIIINSTEVDNDNLVIEQVTLDPIYGNVSFQSNELTYTQSSPNLVRELIKLKVNDGVQEYIVQVIIRVINHTPRLLPVSYTIKHSKIVGGSLDLYLLQGATDEENDPLEILNTFTSVSSEISVVKKNATTATVNVPSTAIGTFYFVATVTDGLDVATTTVTLQVTNAAPVVYAKNMTLHWRQVATGYDITGLLSDATDDDEDTLSIVRVLSPSSSVIGSTSIPTSTSIRISSGSTPQLGSVTLTYVVTDGLINVTSFVEIHVQNKNPYSTGSPTYQMHWREVNVPLNVLANFTDDDSADAAQLQITSVSSLRSSTLSLSTDKRSIIYTPPIKYIGSDTLTFYVTDGISPPIIGNAFIFINNSNPKPLVYNQVIRPSQIPTNGNIVLNVVTDTVDTDPLDADFLAVTPDFLISDPNAGNVTIFGNILVFTPKRGFQSSVVITFSITDQLATVSSTATISINNTSPFVSITGSLQAHWRQVAQTLTLTSFLRDNDGDSVSILSVLSPTTLGGTGSTLSANQVRYTPPGNTKGTDNLRVTFTDGWSDQTFTFTVNVFNSRPVVPAIVTVVTHQSTPITVPIIARNASDADSADTAFLILATTNTFSGSYTATVTRSSDGKSITVNPVVGSMDTQDITYTITDGLETTSGVLRVTIQNNPPVSRDFTMNIHWSTFSAGVSLSLLQNSTDADNDALVVTRETSPAPHGTLSPTTFPDSGIVRFFPAQGNLATTSFRFRVSDRAAFVIQTATFTIWNSAPVAVADSTTQHWKNNTFVMNLLANDVNTDGDNLRITSVQSTLATISSDQKFITFTKTPILVSDLTSFAFTYSITDGLDSSSATVTVTFFNTLPRFTTSAITDSLAWTTAAGSNYYKEYTVSYVDDDSADTVSSMLVNNQEFSATRSVTLTNGVLSMVSGKVRFTANAIPSYPSCTSTCSVQQTFTFSITDGLQTTTQNAQITLTNTRPQSYTRSYTLVRNFNSNTGLLDVMAPEYSTYKDADGNDLSVVVVRSTSPLSAAPSGKRVQVQAPSNFVGGLTFNYVLNDGQLSSTEATVTVTFTNNAPTCTSSPLSTFKNTDLSVYFQTCSDANNDPLTYFVYGITASSSDLSLIVATGSNNGWYQFDTNKEVSAVRITCGSNSVQLTKSNWSVLTWIGNPSPNQCAMDTTITALITLQGGSQVSGTMQFTLFRQLYFVQSTSLSVSVPPPSDTVPTITGPFSDSGGTFLRIRSSVSISNYVLSVGVTDGITTSVFTHTITFASRPPVVPTYTWAISTPTTLPSTYILDYLASVTITDADGDTPTLSSISTSGNTCPAGSLTVTADKKLSFVLPSAWTTSNTCVAKVVVSDQSNRVAATTVGTVNINYTKSNLIARDDYTTMTYNNDFVVINPTLLLNNDEDPAQNLQFNGFSCHMGGTSSGNYCPTMSTLPGGNVQYSMSTDGSSCNAKIIEYQIRSGSNTAVISRAKLYVEITGCKCSLKQDIMFAIHRSSSIADNTFQRMRALATKINTDAYVKMSDTLAKFGAISYSEFDNVNLVSTFRGAKSTFDSAVNGISKSGVLSAPRTALERAKTEFMNQGRSDAVKTTVLLISAEPSSPCASPCALSPGRCMPCADPTTVCSELNQVQSSDPTKWSSRVIIILVDSQIRSQQFMTLAKTMSYDGDRAVIPARSTDLDNSDFYSQLSSLICNTVVVPRPSYPATIRVAVDDEFTMYMNGVEILAGSGWTTVFTTTITIQRGDIISLRAKDWGGADGIQFELRIGNSNSRILSQASDGWVCTKTLPSKHPVSYADFYTWSDQRSPKSVSNYNPLGTGGPAMWHRDNVDEIYCAFSYGYPWVGSSARKFYSTTLLVAVSVFSYILMSLLAL